MCYSGGYGMTGKTLPFTYLTLLGEPGQLGEYAVERIGSYINVF